MRHTKDRRVGSIVVGEELRKNRERGRGFGWFWEIEYLMTTMCWLEEDYILTQLKQTNCFIYELICCCFYWMDHIYTQTHTCTKKAIKLYFPYYHHHLLLQGKPHMRNVFKKNYPKQIFNAIIGTNKWPLLFVLVCAKFGIRAHNNSLNEHKLEYLKARGMCPKLYALCCLCLFLLVSFVCLCVCLCLNVFFFTI